MPRRVLCCQRYRLRNSGRRERIMRDTDRLLNTVRRAASLVRATPSRRGRVVQLNAGEVFVCGDLHGNSANIRQLLERADLAHHPRRHLVVQEIIHGPTVYADGGDKSHRMLDLLSALIVQYPYRVHLLVGNHELAQATGRPVWKGETDLTASFRAGVDTAYGSRGDEVYAAYLALLAVVPVALRTANRVFLSHSLPDAKHLPAFDPAVLEYDGSAEVDLLPNGSIYSLVWGRDTSAENVAEFLRRVDADLLVTGHIGCDRGFHVPHDRQLILDSSGTTGAYCVFPCDRRVRHADLTAGVSTF
jgi:hypothetical protein